MGNKLSENAKLIAEKRYLMLDSQGQVCETIEEMNRRIAKKIASVEIKQGISKKKAYQFEEEVYEVLTNRVFLSGMSFLDRGKNNIVAACYVLPIKDSIESIYTTLLNVAQLHRRGAGIGYDFSPIRPMGEIVHSTGRHASGPISFMRLYDFSSEEIMNNGSVRHAGHMGILRVDHLDIFNFIKAKLDLNQLTNFNISVAITDEFYNAYKSNSEFLLKWPVSEQVEYNADEKDTLISKKINSSELMDLITNSIHRSGEPGFIFIDKVNATNPTPLVGNMTATNQCGEQPLLPYESCNLGSIDVSKVVKETSRDKFEIDWKYLRKVVQIGVRYLDNTINLTNHLLPEIKEIVQNGNRKIGLGIMGWADLLYLMEIPYSSKEARKLADELMHFIWQEAALASSELGKEKGSFGNFKDSKWDINSNIKQAKNNPLRFEHMRNATVTTIAPTGTISLYADCNGGIEPIYALAYKRKNMETLGGKTELSYINEVLLSKLKQKWIYSKQIEDQIIEKGSLSDIKEIPESIKKIFTTALDIKPEDHVLMQAAFQKWTDNAVSKTVNMSEDSNEEDIQRVFELAYESDCKGLTIYRNNSRNEQVLNK